MSLVQTPASADAAPSLARFGPRFVLGTAQIGLPYGIANRTGLPPEKDAVALVRAALDAGVRDLDTARAYGDAERRIGLALAGREGVGVVTKLDPLAGLAADADPKDAVAAAMASVEASRQALRLDRLPTLLLHRAAHRIEWGGAVWDRLLREREAGRVGRLGVSVQSPEELAAAIDDGEVRHVQLPFNLFDRRWRDAGSIDRLRGRPDVTVHARSALLQGLLAAPETAPWPAIPGLDAPALAAALVKAAAALGHAGPADLALGFVRAQDWIAGVVVGVETTGQLAHNLDLFRLPLAPHAAIPDALPPVPAALLDPATWPREDAGR